MTDEYTARERALTLAHADSRDIILPAEDVIELAEKYLAFLMPARPAPITYDIRTMRIGTDASTQLHNGGIFG